jgi:small conductance mechanosensitive channel
MNILEKIQSYINWQAVLDWLTQNGLEILAILVVAYLVQKFSGTIITKVIRKTVSGDSFATKAAEEKRENTLISVFHGVVRLLVWLMAALTILSSIGVNIGPILAGAGVAGVALGFGAQYAVRDFLVGFFIILENQFRIHDWVCIDNNICGEVEYIGLRMTILRDLNGTVHHVPNGQIKVASNMSQIFSRINLDLILAYETNLEKVIEVINKTGRELAEDENWKDKIIDPPKFTRIDKFAESGMVVKILGDTKPLVQWEALGELRKRLKLAFDKEGIVMPYQQIVVHQANSEQGKNSSW